jgi:hypothetical protein
MSEAYTIQQGATFRATLAYMQPTLAVKAISAVSNSIRPTLTAAAHGIPAGMDWPVWIRGVKGMTKLNHDADKVGDQNAAYLATRVDANTLTLHADTSDWPAYASGGEIAYQPPVDLTGCTALMHVRERLIDAVPVLTLSSATAAPASRLTITAASGLIAIEISDEDTAAITWQTAVFDLEITHPDGSTTRLASSEFEVSPEVTRP